jgi:hypothetical protein
MHKVLGFVEEFRRNLAKTILPRESQRFHDFSGFPGRVALSLPASAPGAMATALRGHVFLVV